MLYIRPKQEIFVFLVKQGNNERGEVNLKLTIDSVIRLQDVPTEVLKQIKAELTLENKQYQVMKRIKPRQRWMWGEPVFKLWSEKTVDDSTELILPRGYLARAWNLLGLSWDVIQDKRVKLLEVEYPVKPKLRDYQEPAVNEAKAWQQGVINMPAGSGKTVVGHAIIANLRQPTLWVTHRTDLLQQSMERARTFLGLDDSQMGVIQEDRYSIGSHITFASVQTLCNRDIDAIKNRFGCLVVDECHRCFDDKFSKENNRRMFDSVISEIPAFYRFGLTATVGRSDGLINSMLHIIGPVFYEIQKNDPRLLTLKPVVEFIETDYQYIVEEGEMLSVQSMYTDMKNDGLRNDILFDVLREKIGADDTCICLGHHLSHLEILHSYVSNDLRRKSIFINGSTDMNKREGIFNEVRAGKYQYIFATFSLIKEGLDISRLNKIVFATPVKDSVTVEQAVGRVQRPEDGKPTPVVYDICDCKVPQLKRWKSERKKVYKKIGCEIHICSK